MKIKKELLVTILDCLEEAKTVREDRQDGDKRDITISKIKELLMKNATRKGNGDDGYFHF